MNAKGRFTPMMRFAIGMVVELKSGGPRMTIARYDDAQGVFHCNWFQNSLKGMYFW